MNLFLHSRYRSGEHGGSPTEVPLYLGAVRILLPGLLTDCLILGSLVLRVDIVSLQRFYLSFEFSLDACAGFVTTDP